MVIKKSDYKNFVLLLSLFLGLELVSFLGFFYPAFFQAAFFVLTLGFLFLSLYRPKYALLFVLAELIIGSKGYLLFLPLSESYLLSFRLVIWSLFILIFAGKFFIQLKNPKGRSEYWYNIKTFPLLKPFLFLFSALILGLISAFIYQNSWQNIFFDFNNWLYFLLLFPLIALRPSRQEIIQVFFTAAFWISLKTLILLTIFSNNSFLSFSIYNWLRKTLVGEMTILDGWNRVFIQSQIFVAISYLFLAIRSYNLKFRLKKENVGDWLLVLSGALFFSTIIISLSRSFWVGFAFSLFTLLLFLAWKRGLKKILRPLGYIVVSFVLGVVIILVVIPKNAPTQLDNQLASRISSKEEAAVASRWALLSPLFKEIMKNPVSGQGFGATVTYFSQDPRILQTEASGIYTTYAFEWGYFDIWLKTGLLGLVAYLFLLWILIKKSFVLGIIKNDYFYWGLVAGYLFLATVHFFTPYLNHPLGIGFIITSSCFIQSNRVY
jgi:hypothetical protein